MKRKLNGFFIQKEKKMKSRVVVSIVVLFVVAGICSLADGETYSCEVPDVGVMKPNDFTAKTSIVHTYRFSVVIVF